MGMLDEILRASDGARDELVKLDRLSDDELTRVEKEIVRVRERQRRASGAADP